MNLWHIMRIVVFLILFLIFQLRVAVLIVAYQRLLKRIVS